MARTVKKPDVRKNEILDAAETLFIEKGYENTSIKDIINKVGVAHGLFYYYFKSKEDVLNSMVKRYWIDINRNLKPIVDDPNMNSVEKIENVFMKGIIMKEKKMGILAYVVKMDDPLFLNKLINFGIEIFVPQLTKIVNQGIEEKVFDIEHPETALKIFFVGSAYAYDVKMLQSDQRKYVETIITMFSMLERMLGAKKGTFKGLTDTIRVMVNDILNKYHDALVN